MFEDKDFDWDLECDNTLSSRPKNDQPQQSPFNRDSKKVTLHLNMFNWNILSFKETDHYLPR